MDDWRRFGQDIAVLMSMLGYPGIFVTMLVEGSGVPLPFPGALFLALIGYTVWQGYLDVGMAALVGAAGFSAGAWLLYRLSRYAGPRVASAYGRRFGIVGPRLGAGQRWFARHSLIAVFASRMMPGLRVYISIAAGLARMRQTMFLACTFVGSLLYVGAILIASRLLGENWAQMTGGVDGRQAVLLLVSAVLAVAVAIRRRAAI